jgi:group I intron endonuclease
MVGIYKIENPKGRIYIGQSKDIEVRWRDYRSLRCKGQRKLYYSLNKYGVDRHIFTVQEECELSVLNEKERYWQEYYKVLEGGLNLEINKTTGERKVISEETRERMSAAQRGKTLSDSTKEKISISGKAREYKHTDLAKEAISAALKKRIRKEETTTKIVEKLKGQKRTDASKKRMSQAHTGIKDTDATREAKSAAAKVKKNAGNPQSCKTIRQYSADGEFIREWKSITQAAKEYNTSVANLSVAIKANRLRVGYFWKNNE